MKTIEERADAYVGHPFEIDEFSSTTAKRQAFIDGAKEQREIDMKIFEKWYCEEKCYNRLHCYRPTKTCHRLVKIEKQMLEKYAND